MKTGRCYVEEHMNSGGDYSTKVDNSNDNIVGACIHSRHSNTSIYKAWIQFSFTDDPIEAWYCQCSARARNVGCCCHVASIVWCLSFARYNDFKSSTGRQSVIQAFVRNAQENKTNTDSESSSENE